MTKSRNRIRFGAALCAAALLCLSAATSVLAEQEPRHPGARDGRPPATVRVVPQSPQRDRWFDQGHGHSRYYPRSGYRVSALPMHAPPIMWHGSNYWFWSGVWYAPGPSGYVVVRPPYGVVVADLPSFATAVVIGGITYMYLNGAYYRQRVQGGYEVVPTPVAALGQGNGAAVRMFVYPAKGQTAERQASDEYECHSWAASQSGFDPAPAATGQASDQTHRADYVRAQTACLEGRGYTVR